MLHILARTHLWPVCWLFLLYYNVYGSVRNSFNVCVPPQPLIFLCDHLLHKYRFQNIFLILPWQFEFVYLCQERILFVSMHILYGAVCFFQ